MVTPENRDFSGNLVDFWGYENMGNLCRQRGMLPHRIKSHDAAERTFITGRLLWDEGQECRGKRG